MADISVYLAQILSAVYGEDVRGSIHDAIEIINDVSEVVLSTGTAITSASSSSTGYYEDSLYLNTDTYELWKCVGTDTWASQGIIKGADGSPGAPGTDGNKWYRGTGISGKAVNPTVYSGSGITLANPNDFYLNPSEGAVYHCVTGGDASTATWSYDFTMTGGGGGGSIVGWNQIQTSTGATKIAEITIDGSTTDVYAPQGGGGSSSWGSITGTLSDQTDLQNALNGKASTSDVHTMIPNNTAISSLTAKSQDPTDDDVASGYAISNWSNAEIINLLTTVSQGDDTVGTWEDSGWESGSRQYWLTHKFLYGILSDNSINFEPIFDVGTSEVVSVYAYRVDDEMYVAKVPTTTNPHVEGLYESDGATPPTYTLTADTTVVSGKTYYEGVGAVAMKFNGAIQSNSVTVGVQLKRNRTQTITVSRT